jgi:rRNA maturation protein Nop10
MHLVGHLCVCAYIENDARNHERKKKLYTLSTSAALKGDGWSAPCPGRFTPRKTRYPLYRRLCGPQGRSGCARKISPLSEFDPLDYPARSQSLYRLSHQWQSIVDKKNKEMFGKGETRRVAGGQKSLVVVAVCQCQN